MPHGVWGWKPTSATDEGGGTPAAGGVHGYALGSQKYLVYAASEDLSVHELVFDGSGWRDYKLTDLGGGPSVAVGAYPPVGYPFVTQGTRHVIYVGDNGAPTAPKRDLHIYELWLDASGWHHKDLMLEADGAPGSVLKSPCAYLCDFDGTQHVDYVGEDGHIHELWWDDDGWQHHDLSDASGAPPAAAGASPTGYVSSARLTQHVDYIGVDGQLHEIRWSDGTWSRNDPDFQDGLGGGAAAVSPWGYVSNDGIQRVAYVGSDGHIYEASFDGHRWTQEQASAGVGALAGGDGFALAAFSDESRGVRHIVLTGGGPVHDLWRDATGWHYTNLTLVSGSLESDIETRLVGFVVPAQQTPCVVYESINFRVTTLEWLPRPTIELPQALIDEA